MKVEYTTLPITKLVPANWNYKTNSKTKMDKLIQNIKKNGQLETIIVRELKDNTYEVVNGNHRLEVFKHLGINDVKVCNLGFIDDLTAKRIAIETNETHFDSDAQKLSSILDELVNSFQLTDLLSTIDLPQLDALTIHNIHAHFSTPDIPTINQQPQIAPQVNRTLAVILSPELYDKFYHVKQQNSLDSDYNTIKFLVEYYFNTNN